MNLLAAWKKVLLFGLFGAVGCLAGWAVGEAYLAIARAATDTGTGQAGSLISKPIAPSDAAPAPPNEFKSRLEREKAKTGDVQLSLIWFDKNDLDLHCVDPTGAEIFFNNRRSKSGGELDVDANAGRLPLTSEPIENIYWPKDGAPPGKYTVFINFYNHRPDGGSPRIADYKVSVLFAGNREEYSDKIEYIAGGDNRRNIRQFELYPKVELFAPTELNLPPSAVLKVPVAVRRMYYKGEITLRAENLPDGVTAEPATIPPGKSEGELILKATESAKEIKKAIKIVGTGGDLAGSADSQLTVPKPEAQFSLTTVIIIGIWTALLAVGLCLALLMGQNKYLHRPLFAAGRIPLVAVIAGAVAAGFVSGSVGQTLYSLFLAIGIGSLGFLVGWVLLGGLLGLGISYFVANLDRKKAGLAGLAGGLLGAVAYLVFSRADDWVGRFAGAAALGFCIGLVVAVVEAAFRRAWLEVRFGERETITVNLGPEPVKVGGDAKACTVWARGAADVALRFFIRNGAVICEDVPTRTESVVGNGHTQTAGTVTLTVRTGATATSNPPVPPRPAAPRLPSKPAATPELLSLDDAPPLAAIPVAASPPVRPPEPPKPVPVATPKSPIPDDDDGLPMPMSNAPPTRPVVKSILDDDGFAPPARPLPAKPPLPASAKPPLPVSAKPPLPTSARPPLPTSAKPPLPVSTKPPTLTPAAPKPPVPVAAKPPLPTAPKPPAPPMPGKVPMPMPPKPPAVSASPPTATPPKPIADAEGCPTCGRKAPGRPGMRYCMLCDKTY